jgi:hypothetical protein
MDLITLNNLEQAKQESIQTLNYNSFFKIREMLYQADSLNMKVKRDNEEMEFKLKKSR